MSWLSSIGNKAANDVEAAVGLGRARRAVQELAGELRAVGAIRRSRRGQLGQDIALYLAHVELSVPLRALVRASGRDRATLRRRVQHIEGRRDNLAFDGLLANLAEAARCA